MEAVAQATWLMLHIATLNTCALLVFINASCMNLEVSFILLKLLIS